jgi:hypothetical protein
MQVVLAEDELRRVTRKKTALRVALSKAVLRTVNGASASRRNETAKKIFAAASDVILKAQSVRSFTVSAAAGPSLHLLSQAANGRVDPVTGVKEIITVLMKNRGLRRLLFRAVARAPTAMILAVALTRVDAAVDSQFTEEEAHLLAPVSLACLRLTLFEAIGKTGAHRDAALPVLLDAVKRSTANRCYLAGACGHVHHAISTRLSADAPRHRAVARWLEGVQVFVSRKTSGDAGRVPPWIAPGTAVARAAMRFLRLDAGQAPVGYSDAVLAELQRLWVEVEAVPTAEQWAAEVLPVLHTAEMLPAILGNVERMGHRRVSRHDSDAVKLTEGAAALGYIASVANPAPMYLRSQDERMKVLRTSLRARNACKGFFSVEALTAFATIASQPEELSAAERALLLLHIARQLRDVDPHSDLAPIVASFVLPGAVSRDPASQNFVFLDQLAVSESRPLVQDLMAYDQASTQVANGTVWTAAALVVASVARVGDRVLESAGRADSVAGWSLRAAFVAVALLCEATSANAAASSVPVDALAALIRDGALVACGVEHVARAVVCRLWGVDPALLRPRLRESLGGFLRACTPGLRGVVKARVLQLEARLRPPP